jgi:3D (Asp-Asp-Asp) domain-containing protein
MRRFSPKVGLGLALVTALALVGPVFAQEGSGNADLPEHSNVAPAREMRHHSFKFKHRIHTLNARNRNSHGRFDAAPASGAGRQISVSSTAYCLRGFTSRGTSVSYGTVAVDPRIIPMGSKVYIPGYGWGRALDVGGGVRGNTIDVWLPTVGQCMQWGRRSVTITVVPPGR